MAMTTCIADLTEANYTVICCVLHSGFGNSAMAEAVKGAHDKIVALLLSYGAS